MRATRQRSPASVNAGIVVAVIRSKATSTHVRILGFTWGLLTRVSFTCTKVKVHGRFCISPLSDCSLWGIKYTLSPLKYQTFSNVGDHFLRIFLVTETMLCCATTVYVRYHSFYSALLLLFFKLLACSPYKTRYTITILGKPGTASVLSNLGTSGLQKQGTEQEMRIRSVFFPQQFEKKSAA